MRRPVRARRAIHLPVTPASQTRQAVTSSQRQPPSYILLRPLRLQCLGLCRPALLPLARRMPIVKKFTGDAQA
jgi:hypothetical protein